MREGSCVLLFGKRGVEIEGYSSWGKVIATGITSPIREGSEGGRKVNNC
jgi:hypothetical protein